MIVISGQTQKHTHTQQIALNVQFSFRLLRDLLCVGILFLLDRKNVSNKK